MSLVGTRTLFLKEGRRFGKIWVQTLVSPLVTTSVPSGTRSW